MATEQSHVSLVDLPDPCLLAVLRCCAGDPRTLCSAARAHSRLHQAAVEALSSIMWTISSQQQSDCLANVYLSKHGQHVDSISLKRDGDSWRPMSLRQLPSALTKLTSLELANLKVQLQPGSSYQGVLGAAAAPPLKRLQFDGCMLFDRDSLAASVLRLPGLEHLSLKEFCTDIFSGALAVPGDVLLELQQLSHLELKGVRLGHPDDNSALQQLSALTRLADLRLGMPGDYSITASMLSGAQHLTHLQLGADTEGNYIDVRFEPAVLAGKTLLQHLELQSCTTSMGASGAAQLLSELRQLQQLTCLILTGGLNGPYAPAAAYSALTASSTLHHLNLSDCCLPAGAWQHVFPAGRQLPHLRSLDISGVMLSEEAHATLPEGSRLVSCCPGLQSLNMQRSGCISQLLDALQGLSGLHTLAANSSTEGVFLQLTQLRHLTALDFVDCREDSTMFLELSSEGPDDEPVWRQLLRQHLHDSDPAVAQHAAAALAERHA